MKNLGKVPIQQKKKKKKKKKTQVSTIESHTKVPECWTLTKLKLKTKITPPFFFCVHMGSSMMYVKVFE